MEIVSKSLTFSSLLSVVKFYELSDNTYILPPYRFTPYAMGILLGYVLRKYKDFMKPSKPTMLFGWLIATLCLIATHWMCFSSQVYSPLTAARFSAIAPITWCFVFAWIIFSAQTGYKSKKSFQWALTLKLKSFYFRFLGSFC